MEKYLKDIKWFRFNPNKDLPALVISYILVVAALYTATFIVTAKNGGLYFIFYALVCATLCGVGIPVFWTVIVRKRPLSDLGITKKNLKLSLIIQLILGLALYVMKLRYEQMPPFSYLAPLIALVLAVGFFEAVFWRGWIFSRLEDAFGLIPALVLGSALYAAYHIGYGMSVNEMTFLFFIGLMFALVFRITKSVFILWPVFQPMGQMITLLKETLPLPMIAVLGFAEALVAMFVISFLTTVIAKKKGLTLAR